MNVFYKPGVNDRADGAGKEFLWTQTSKVGDRGLEQAWWIWHARDMLADPEKRSNMRFTRTYDLPDLPASAWIRISAQGTYTLTINGKEVGSDDQAFTLDWYDLKAFLTKGVNTFDVRVRPNDWFSGFFTAGEVGLADGKTLDIWTDCSWSVERMDEALLKAESEPKPAAELVAGVDGGFWNNCGRLFEFPPEYYQLNTQLATPGIDWAQPYAGGPVSVAAVHPLKAQRDTVELVLRTGFDVTVFPSEACGNALKFSRSPFFPREKGLFWDEVAANMRDALSSGADVMLFLGTGGADGVPEGTNLFYDGFADGLRAYVEKGGGLVYTDRAIPPRLIPTGEKDRHGRDAFDRDDAFEKALTAHPVSNAPAFLMTAAPFGKLPGFYLRDRDAVRGFQSYAQLFTLGKGRVVKLRSGDFVNRSKDSSDLHYQYYMSFAIKALLWAAKKEPGTQFVALAPVVTATNGIATDCRLQLSQVPAGCALDVAVRSPLQDFIEAGTPQTDQGVSRGAALLSPVSQWREEVAVGDDLDLTIKIPSLPAGEYFVDFRLLDGEGTKLDWAACALSVTSTLDIAAIELSKEYIDVVGGRGDELSATVRLTGGMPGAGKARVTVVDNFDRVVRIGSVSLEAGQAAFDVSFVFKRFDTTLGRMRVELSVGGRVVALKAAEFTAVRRDWDRYMLTGWGSWDESYQGNVYWRVLADLGVDAPRSRGISLKWLDAAEAVACPGYPAFPRYGREDIDHAKVLRDYGEKARAAAESQLRFDPVAFNTGDEFTYRRNEEQPSRVRLYREFLEGKYGSIRRLNEVWGTAYPSFDEVFPLLDGGKLAKWGKEGAYGSESEFLARAGETRNYARYVDQWLDNYRAFNDTARVCLAAIKQVMPFARVGCDCPMWPTPQSGHDWYRFLQEFDHFAPYGRGGEIIPLKQARSYFSPERGQFIGLTYGGYLYMAFNRKEELTDTQWQSWRIWSGLFQGFTSLWWYNFGPGSEEGNLSPGYVPYESLKVPAAAIAEYRDGVYDLLKPTRVRRDYGGIAVYDSVLSRIVAGVVGEGFGVGGYGYIMNTHILGQVLENHVGVDYTFVDAEQIANGGLKEYTCLLMPMTLAVSDKEAKALRAFIRRGGVVIADVRPGLFDGSGKWTGADSRVAELFGVTFSSGLGRKLTMAPVKGTFMGRAIDVTPQREYPVEQAMSLDGATALADAEGAPVVTVNAVGKGYAVCLNTSFTFYEATVMLDSHYAYKPNRYHGAFMRDLLRQLFAAAGVKAPVKVEHAGEQWPYMLNVAYLPEGKAQYIGVTKGRQSDHEGNCNVRLTPPSGGHVYDVRTGEYLGAEETVALDLSAVDVRLLSVLPYKVEQVSVEMEPTAVEPGGVLTLKLGVDHRGKGVRHVLNVRAFRPDGLRAPYLTRNVELEAGRKTVSVTLPFAYNEPRGGWGLVVRDVASRVETALTFEVR